VALVVHDDASSSTRAALNVERLIVDDRVDVLIGPYGSDLVRAAAPVAARHGRLMWNQGGASDDIHGLGGRIVGVLTPVSRYFAGFLDSIAGAGSPAQSVVSLYREGSPFGLLAAQGVEAECRLKGIAYTPLPYSSLRSGMPELLERVQELRPDIVLSAGAFKDDCTLARELVARGVGAAAFGCVAAGIQEFGRVLGADAEGIVGPSQWEADVEWRADYGPSGNVVTRHVEALGATPDYPAAQAFAACLIAQRCLEMAGTAEDERLWESACELDCTTFLGPFRIDPDTGLQFAKQMVRVQWLDGKKQVVGHSTQRQ
jgi:branched-chain amino acid transport system substrate-binding protein